MKAPPGPDSLLAAVRTAAGRDDLDWARPPEPLTGGFWAQIWRVRLARAPGRLDRELVARVMPDPETGVRETAVQAHLADCGYPTPTVRLAAGPGAELDRAWMLMDLAAGRTLLAGLSGPAALARLPRMARSLPDRLARHTAALHAVDPGSLAARLGSADEPAGMVAQQSSRAAALGRTDLAGVAEWLHRHQLPEQRTVVCHGDLHPLNILSAPAGDTVLDWSSSRITDPAYDIAFTHLMLSHPPLVAPPALRPVIGAGGRFLARRFVRTYDTISSEPVDRDELVWFTSLHVLRMVTDVATWQAGGDLDQHPGHPFLMLHQPFIELLADTTGITVSSQP